MAPMARTSPMVPYDSSSVETLGPTTSTRRYSTSSPSASRTFCTAACCASSPPGCSETRISTSLGAPNSCSWKSPSFSPPMVARIFARSAGPALVCTSIKVPPMKSMPKFSPWKKNSEMATIDSSADTGKLMRRKRMKSNRVSSGTIRRRRTGLLSKKVYVFEHDLIRKPVSTFRDHALDRNRARPPQPHPVGHDQTGQREGGEQAGEDADAKRHGKAAHRPGADIEQHRGGDEGGDVGIEDGGEGAGEAGIDGIDGAAAAADLLADALIDQHVGIHRDADREHDPGDARQRQRGAQ